MMFRLAATLLDGRRARASEARCTLGRLRAGLRAAAWALCVASVVVSAGGASAAAKERPGKKNFAPSEAVGKRLLKVSELAEEEKYAEAEAVLEPLTKKTRLSKFDRASVFQTYGLMLAAQEKYKPATSAFETALAVDYLPDAAMQSLRYNLAQLYLADEKFDRAAVLLEEWMQHEEKPNAQAEFLLTVAYAQTEKWDKALEHGRKAVALSDEPTEQRLGLLLAIEYQNGNLPESLALLEQLVTHFPKKRYLMQLAAAYSTMGDEERALATLELADQQGWLDQEREVLQLAQRYQYHDLPWPAANTLIRAMEAGTVSRSVENLELLANALLSAREYKKAIEPLSEAAKLSPKGDLYVRLAQVYLEDENWSEARAALDAAIAKGGLRDSGNAYLLLGISNYNEDRLQSARTAFNQALRDDSTASSAERWLEYVDRAEQERALLSSEGDPRT